VFQNPEDHLFLPRLMDDLTLPLRNRGVDDAAAADMALRALRTLDLEAYRDEPAAHLSLGMRKRAALAAALATNPELLILDEPTAELDNRSARRLGDHLAGLAVPCLVTSHHLDFLRRATERLIVLIDGSIAAAGPTLEILDDRRLLDRAALI
jgi:energy-coupling factor transporter ATP-binding protein EcfA2